VRFLGDIRLIVDRIPMLACWYQRRVEGYLRTLKQLLEASERPAGDRAPQPQS
jgi:hypothetical protein